MLTKKSNDAADAEYFIRRMAEANAKHEEPSANVPMPACSSPANAIATIEGPRPPIILPVRKAKFEPVPLSLIG